MSWFVNQVWQGLHPPCKGPRSISLSLPPSLPANQLLAVPAQTTARAAGRRGAADGPFDDGDDGAT